MMHVGCLISDLQSQKLVIIFSVLLPITANSISYTNSERTKGQTILGISHPHLDWPGQFKQIIYVSMKG